MSTQLCVVLVLGVAAQWIAWRVGVPSILFLLLFGIAAGPGLGLIAPSELFGPLLLPLVSVLVAVILFEGGLSLRTAELRSAGRPFLGLATVGIALTFALASIGAAKILRFDSDLALLFGAILVVTGPTVVLPLLQHARPAGAVAPILRWEAIVLDPVGAVLAVFIFEAIVKPELGHGAFEGAVALLRAVAVGALAGLLGAGFILQGIRRGQIPENLQNPMVLAALLTAFTAANMFQSESGLFAVTLFGAILANQSELQLRHVLRFKETLSTLILGILFILLGGRLTRAEITSISWEHLWFVVYLVLIVRPVAVIASTAGSGLRWNEKLYLSCIAPRGIVAAAVCSVFALAMQAQGISQSERLVSSMFVVILSTVTIAALLARPLGRALGLVYDHPQGILFVGAERLTRTIAAAVKEAGIPVLLIENDWNTAASARLEGVPVHFGDLLSTRITEDIDLGNYGRLCALSSNSELNALACVRFRKVFGHENVYQLPFPVTGQGKRTELRAEARGRYLFAESASFSVVNDDFGADASIKTTTFTKEFDFKAYCERYGTDVLPLFLLPAAGQIEPITADASIAPTSGQSLISLVRKNPGGEASARTI